MVSDIAGLKDNTSALSVLTNEKGGCIDDTIISKASDEKLQAQLRTHRAAARRHVLGHLPC